MTLSRAERKHLQQLRRRSAWIQQRITEKLAQGIPPRALTFLYAESAAIAWVFQLVDDIEDDGEAAPAAAVERRGNGGHQGSRTAD